MLEPLIVSKYSEAVGNFQSEKVFFLKPPDGVPSTPNVLTPFVTLLRAFSSSLQQKGGFTLSLPALIGSVGSSFLVNFFK